MTNEELLLNGLALPLMEDFYTIQGEGFHTGKPAYFTRVGGCDVGCSWCDVKESWNADIWPLTSTDEIVKRVVSCPSKAVVVTGGEPLMYNLDYYCDQLKKAGFETYLETSGSHPLSGKWDWICLSPKKYSPPLEAIYEKADEYKVIIQTKGDFDWAEKNAERLRKDCKLYLQPEWSKAEAMMPLIVEYVKEHPRWNISLQSHKYMRIP
ncbi:MAG TPA: 7-carboxy-7-deazaguanine synthase QueE [Bacteroidales bacterium]|mgnify:CR=1 FL=1|nr:7-carboxy-7-deazaguanine synthase QueE [Bacteroidales bacterium]HPE56994.1 7-carboxy-7-deazaguanine synthase QueE [Bacteroidales bacterium]HRX96044.1 7-carboxy-7-deazaguanine synthase QueE [Bacteroidales bacterium]